MPRGRQAAEYLKGASGLRAGREGFTRAGCL